MGTYNPATEQREFILIPTSEEVAMGQSLHEKISKEYQLADDDARTARVRDVGWRISQVSDRQDIPYKFFVIEKDEINAFTIPGGNVYIYTGLLDKLKTDDQLAFVLAHEIGHGAAKHSVKKFQAAMGYSLIGGIIIGTIDSDTSAQIAALSSSVAMNIIFSAYGRKDEHQADELGVKYMYLAGYDLNGAIQALEVLNQEAKGPGVPLFLRTHPYLEDRIEDVQEEIRAIGTEYGGEG